MLLYSSMLQLPSSVLGYPLGLLIQSILDSLITEVASTLLTNSYLIIIKSLMPNVVAALYYDLTSPDTNPPAWALSGHIWITIIMLFLIPLTFLRKLDSLRHTSYIALFSVGACNPHPLPIDFSQTCFFSHSISCRNCHCMLLQTSERHHRTWGDPSDLLHPQLHLHIPRTSVCLYLCSERKWRIYIGCWYLLRFA